MKKRYILILGIILAIFSVSVVSAGLFDGLFGEEQQDNVIEIEGISFNTTNASDFKENKSFSKDASNEAIECSCYRSDNGTGDYYVIIGDYNAAEEYYEDIDDIVADSLKEDLNKDVPYQTINGVVVYTASKVTGVDVGKPINYASVLNADLNKLVVLASSDANETAKMVLSLKFNDE